MSAIKARHFRASNIVTITNKNKEGKKSVAIRHKSNVSDKLDMLNLQTPEVGISVLNLYEDKEESAWAFNTYLGQQANETNDPDITKNNKYIKRFSDEISKINDVVARDIYDDHFQEFMGRKKKTNEKKKEKNDTFEAFLRCFKDIVKEPLDNEAGERPDDRDDFITGSIIKRKEILTVVLINNSTVNDEEYTNVTFFDHFAEFSRLHQELLASKSLPDDFDSMSTEDKLELYNNTFNSSSYIENHPGATTFKLVSNHEEFKTLVPKFFRGTKLYRPNLYQMSASNMGIAFKIYSLRFKNSEFRTKKATAAFNDEDSDDSIDSSDDEGEAKSTKSYVDESKKVVDSVKADSVKAESESGSGSGSDADSSDSSDDDDDDN
jgi:hypothetical protein